MSEAQPKKQDPRTVFVRGVDASVTDEALQELFGEVGPVKNAFLVRRGKGGPHRGFGFVQFAVQEDAARAAAQLHGTELAGRKLKVEGAVKRAPLEERKKRKQEGGSAPQAAAVQQQTEPAAAAPDAAEQPPPAKKPRPAAKKPAGKPDAAVQAKHKWLRTVAVGGLTPDAVAAAIQAARGAGAVQEVVSPVPDALAAQFMLRRDGCTGESFLAVYGSVKEAMQAVARLHGQVVGGSAGATPAGAKKKQQQQGAGGAASQGCRLWARQLSGDGLHQKRWRLIVRNLPFTATEADLRAAFAPAGFVWEATLPRSAAGRGRGFAFVGFTCKAHAERGIRAVNGQPVAGRTVAVDWAVGKAQFGQEAQAAGASAAAAAPLPPGGSLRELMGIDALDSDSEDEGGAAGPPAKLGHEDEEEEGTAEVQPEQERRMLASVIDGILDDGSDGEGAARAAAAGEAASSEPEGRPQEEEEEADEEAGSGSEDEQPAAPQPAADPFSRKQLQQKAAGAAAAGAGAAEPARQRPEPEAGATVFVRGLPLDVSKEQLFQKMKAYGPVRSCRLVVDKASGKLKGTAFVDYYRVASAEAAAAACAKGRRKEGPGVVVAGRVAEVDVALGQEDVRALAAAKAAERGPRDSRRLALAKEGHIAEGSPAWEDMSAGDRAKRKRAAEETKLKLKSPNFVVSGTRLSVRNIPPTWTEKQLKATFVAAVKQRASKAQPQVRQVKILMDEERPGADGAPRSKGIGFVEFAEHEHALCALRQLNNNPTAFSKERRPIVEFALENVKALKLREAKLAKSKQPREPRAQQPQEQPPADDQQQTVQQPGGQGAEGAEPAEPKSKRQLRKERRLMLKQRRNEQKQQQAGGGGGDDAVPVANGGPADAEKGGKAARRRELRKRKQEGRPATVAGAASTPVRKIASVGDKLSQPAPGGKQQPKQQAQQQVRPGVNSRTAKQLVASQQEQQVQRRKRSADELIDRLAGGQQGELRARKARKKEQTDSVDVLAKAYVAKYFSDAPAAGGKHRAAKAKRGGTAAGQGAALKHWFD